MISQRLKLIDLPDKTRKFHKKKTPLLGGIMFFSTLILLFLYELIINENSKMILLIFLISFLCFFVGLIDDIFKISYRYKFIFLSFIFYFFVTLLPELQITKVYFSTFDKFIYFGNFSVLFSVVCLLLLSNAINLIDGINGLCIIICIIIFSWVNLTFENTNFIYAIIASLILILFYNLKDNIFLGDSGSLLLGSLIGLLIIYNYNNELTLSNFPVENIFIVLMIPGIDMLRVFALRLLNKKNPFHPDRKHLHHMLLDKKFKLYQILILTSVLSILPIVINSLTRVMPVLTILLSITIYTIIIFLIRKKSQSN